MMMMMMMMMWKGFGKGVGWERRLRRLRSAQLPRALATRQPAHGMMP
jgi:hypothetical protein